MSTGSQIDNYIRRHKRDNFIWGGVYPSDKLPKVHPTILPYRFIFNSDSSKSPGNHWLFISLFEPNNEAFYFDSFGMSPSLIHGIMDDDETASKVNIIDYIKKVQGAKVHIIQNNIDLQDLYSDTCGNWAVYACLNGMPQTNKKAWKKILDIKFKDDRDKMIKQLIML